MRVYAHTMNHTMLGAQYAHTVIAAGSGCRIMPNIQLLLHTILYFLPVLVAGIIGVGLFVLIERTYDRD